MEFRAMLQPGAKDVWQFRVEKPKWRFRTYLLLTLLLAGVGGYSMTSEALEGTWFFALAFLTLLLAFYYPVVLCFTPEYFGIRMKLLQMLCINEGWLVFDKRCAKSISEEYHDRSFFDGCSPLLCFGFDDWANWDGNRTMQKTLTIEMDPGFKWGRYVTVKMDPPPGSFQQVVIKTGIAAANEQSHVVTAGAFKSARVGGLNPYGVAQEAPTERV